MKTVVFHEQARAELHEAMAFYEQQSPGLESDLLIAVEQAVERIQEHPQIAPLYKETTLRSFKLQRFPYAVFYTELEKDIWIVAIAHEKRRPDYWIARKLE